MAKQATAQNNVRAHNRNKPTFSIEYFVVVDIIRSIKFDYRLETTNNSLHLLLQLYRQKKSGSKSTGRKTTKKKSNMPKVSYCQHKIYAVYAVQSSKMEAINEEMDRDWGVCVK